MWSQVGNRIYCIRKERHLSRAQFAKMIGTSEQYVGKIERGMHNISGVVIVNICQATGVSADFILFGIVNPTSVAMTLSGLTQEQINIALDIVKRLAQLINTDSGNNALIREILLQQQAEL